MNKIYCLSPKNISIADFLRISIFLFACVCLNSVFVAAQRQKGLENDFTASSPNGKLAFANNGQIFTMDADGSNRTAITDGRSPQWSSDGTKIAFLRNVSGSIDIYTMDADGSNQLRITNMGNNWMNGFGWSPDKTKFTYGAGFDVYIVNADGTNSVSITTNAFYDADPRFSPDGSKVIFMCSRPYDGKPPTRNDDVCVVNIDGTNEVNLTHHPAADHGGIFSPDGSKVVFVSNRGFSGTDVFVINSDGSNLTNITNSPDIGDSSPAWSPDGTKIAFFSNGNGLYVMNSDGTNPTRITNTLAGDTTPSWQRVDSNATVGGRVVTIGGRALSNVQIVMIDSNGNLRTSLSNSFGYFNFDNVSTGTTYNFSVSSKRYIFSQDSQDRIIIGNTENINFIAND